MASNRRQNIVVWNNGVYDVKKIPRAWGSDVNRTLLGFQHFRLQQNQVFLVLNF